MIRADYTWQLVLRWSWNAVPCSTGSFSGLMAICCSVGWKVRGHPNSTEQCLVYMFALNKVIIWIKNVEMTWNSHFTRLSSLLMYWFFPKHNIFIHKTCVKLLSTKKIPFLNLITCPLHVFLYKLMYRELNQSAVNLKCTTDSLRKVRSGSPYIPGRRLEESMLTPCVFGHYSFFA